MGYVNKVKDQNGIEYDIHDSRIEIFEGSIESLTQEQKEKILSNPYQFLLFRNGDFLDMYKFEEEYFSPSVKKKSFTSIDSENKNIKELRFVKNGKKDTVLQINLIPIGGGSPSGESGVEDVQIEKIYLKHTNREKVLTLDNQIVAEDDKGEYKYCNDAEKSKICIKTTRIDSRIENEIKAGRFVIRFNYPVKGRKRGFTNHLTDGDIKMNGIIFITEDNVYENAYGEKYIYYEESFKNFVNRFFLVDDGYTEFENFNNNAEHSSLLNAFFLAKEDGDVSSFAGVPHFNEENEHNWGTWGTGLSKLKLPLSYNGDNIIFGKDEIGSIQFIQKMWADTKHNFWCPLWFADYSSLEEFVVISSFAWRKKVSVKATNCKFTRANAPLINPSSSGGDTPAIYRFVRNGRKIKRRFLEKVCLNPSCAILNLDYASLTENENCWLKTYSQSKQKINLGINAVYGAFWDNRDINYVAIAHLKIN